MAAATGVLDAPRAAVAAVLPAKRLSWVALWLILAVQAVLSVRLLAHNYASGDEGRYIYAGHELIREFWHGGGSPYYETYFSGTPVIFPLLAAMADHLGGLAEVRLMSLAFMLAATSLLFTTTRRLFGPWPGVLAAALFAGLGLTQDLGALATPDAMSLMLTAAATYCAVRTSDAEPHATSWLLAVPAVLLAANATKYVTVVFDPVVILLAALQVSDSGWRRVLKRLVSLSLATLAVLGLALSLAGVAYLKGILFSTIARKAGTQAVFAATRAPLSFIVADSWNWIGIAIAGGAISLVMAIGLRRNWKIIAIIALFLLAGTMVTFEGLHLHTVESLRKHDDFAAWFACAAAGAVAYRVRLQEHQTLKRMAIVLVAAVTALSGLHYTQLASSTFEAGGSPLPLHVAALLKPYLRLPNGRFLLGGIGDDEILYMDHLTIPWYRHVDDLYIKYPIPGGGGDSHGQAQGPVCMTPAPHCMYLEGIAGYRAAIHAHWFTLISMWADHGSLQDAAIMQAVQQTPGYVQLTRVGGAPIWIYAAAYHSTRAQLSGHSSRAQLSGGR